MKVCSHLRKPSRVVQNGPTLDRIIGKSVNIPDTQVPEDNSVPSININSASETGAQCIEINVQTPAGFSISQDSQGRTKQKSRPAVNSMQARGIGLGTLCAGCYGPLGEGRIVRAGSKKFHPKCFNCGHCGIALEHVAFYEQDGQVYCHLDYHELFSPRCHVCSTPIENEVVKALGKTYHPLHFFCAGCGNTFGEDVRYIERENYAWCGTCYENKYSARYPCKRCKNLILDEVVKLDGGATFHPDCFTCGTCGRGLEKGFYWSLKDEAMCRQCKDLETKRLL